MVRLSVAVLAAASVMMTAKAFTRTYLVVRRCGFFLWHQAYGHCCLLHTYSRIRIRFNSLNLSIVHCSCCCYSLVALLDNIPSHGKRSRNGIFVVFVRQEIC